MSIPTVSVVMPVYGVEKYLRNSIECILNQTFSDFQLILIDDKSPDNCPKICDEYALKDERIKVIHLNENGGLSNARNEGMAVAEGKYIFFPDSDDSFSERLLETAVASMTENPAQVVIFGVIEDYYNKDGENYSSAEVFCQDKILKTKNDVRREVIHLEDKGIYGYAWNKLYDLEYIRKTGVEFKKVALIEDILFNVELFEEIECVNVLSNTLYHYRKNNSSSLTGKYIDDYYVNIMLRIKAVYDQYERWELLNDEVKVIIANRYSRYFFSSLQRNCDKKSGMSAKDRKEFFDKEVKGELFGKLSNYMSTKGLPGIMSSFFKSKNRFMCLFIGRVIFLVKKYLPKVFERIN